MMREIASDILKEVGGVAQRGPIHLTLRLNAVALAIAKTNARPPHPPHRCAPQARA